MTTLVPRLKRAASILICAAVFLTAFGCSRAKRTVYVPDGSPVRLRATLKNSPVWVEDENGVWIPGTVDLPEGWYALPDPDPTGGGTEAP